ncbi:mitochondrial glutamate carrier 2-like [Ptychodera flava]|uniref:mitochondrial glutamate carrier 2-like n=1 Tax=Ptychodera flava TaxID=63121 RepID=UPI00396A41F0
MVDLSLPAKCINGGVAGVVGVSCVFPIDLVKTRLQNQQIKDGVRMYNNMLDCFLKVFKAEGLRGLYKGIGVNVTLITPEKAIKLVGNDFFRYILRTEGKSLPLYREMIAGGGAGLCQVIITSPMELLKIQQQDAGRQAQKNIAQASGATEAAVKVSQTRNYSAAAVPKPKSALQTSLELLRTKGIVGLYRGYGATLLRDIPFSMIYFPLFAHLNALGKPADGGRASFLHSLVSGCIAGGVSSISVNPMDVIKTRLQLLSTAQGDTTYTGIRDCAVKIWRQEGWTAFYKGAGCRIVVIAPLFGIAQSVYYIGVGEYILGIEHNRYN